MKSERPGFDLMRISSLYFIGIGGIGMSALARYFHGRGVAIAGYDRYRSVLSRQLEDEGMAIHYEIDPQQIPDGVDAVIYTPAIPAGQAELAEVRSRGIPLFKRAEMLGMISEGMRTIAVAGTHGKTSTSVLLSHILTAAGMPVTAFLGGIAVNYESNFLSGDSNWAVLEADEYDRSFLRLRPEIAVINSLDPDHLDIYGDHRTMLENYFRFAGQIRNGGTLYVTRVVRDLLDPGLIEDLRMRNIGLVMFGLDSGENRGKVTSQGGGKVTFDVKTPDHTLTGLEMRMPGAHNVQNATVAVGIALQLGLDPEKIRAGLASFRGIKRRFEYFVQTQNLVMIDDYAHHPTELQAAISAARAQFPKRKLTVVFQPHLYTRTRDFAPGFAHALEGADQVILVEIYPAREEPIPGVDSEMIYRMLKNDEKYLSSKSELIALLKRLRPGILLTLGAGDLDAMLPEIEKALKATYA